MNLSRASAVIRPRTAWEAMDLGIRLVQRDFFPLAARWVICTTPWAIAAFLTGQWLGNALWGYLLFWWMKPAFDRVPLEYLSRRLFSGELEQTNLWHLCVRLPLAYGAWRHLTYLRFGLARAFILPVDQLEGQDATTRRFRIQTIVARNYGPAAWLSIILFFMALAAHLAISSFLLSLWQPHQPFDTPVTMLEQYLESWAAIPGPVAYVDFLAFYIVHSVIELFYVGAGFALYLNRRTHLEAWDIELAFRRLAARLKTGATVVLLLLCLGASLPGVDALAQPATPQTFSERSTTPQPIALPNRTSAHTSNRLSARRSDHTANRTSERVSNRATNRTSTRTTERTPDHTSNLTAASRSDHTPDQSPDLAPNHIPDQMSLESQRLNDRATIRSILDSGAFGKLETVMKWQKKERPENAAVDDADANAGDAAGDDAANLMNFVVSALKYMIIALFASLLGSWIFRHRHLLFATGTSTETNHKNLRESGDSKLPNTVQLDPDVPDTVMTIWNGGARREALSYFYRAALAYLATRHSLSVHDSATEGEALALVKDCADANVYQYFSEVTKTWRNLAYAQRMPSDESIMALCNRWSQLSQANHER